MVSRETSYLQQVLALDPASEAEGVLLLRREFLQPDGVILADLADDGADTADLRTQTMHRLNALRRDFWNLDVGQLARRLSALQDAAHAEAATAAARLQQVAGQREAMDRLFEEPGVHPPFVKALTEILVAPAAEASRLRECQHRYMRPEQNRSYGMDHLALKNTAKVIRAKYPDVFVLEEAWLTELIDYNPEHEFESESANILLGLTVIVIFVVTLAAIGSIIFRIF